MTVDTVEKIIKIGQQKLNILYKEKWPSVGLDFFWITVYICVFIRTLLGKGKKVKFTILH